MEFLDVALAAPSLEDQLHFYGGTLALPVEVADAGAGEVAFRAGRTRIRFRRADPGTAPSYHFAFRVPGNRFAEAKAWLEERTDLLADDGVVEFDWGFWGARAVYARDPAGSVVELIAFEGLDVQAAEGFSGASIAGLAELGLPVADPAAAVAELCASFGLSLWDREEVSPGRITPVGRRGAAFIVVPLGRPWYLGDRVGADHPLEVTLAGVGDDELEVPGHPYRIRGAGTA